LKSARGELTAEMGYHVERFDPAELYSYEQARDLSIDLLKEWLVKWKFKDWTTTEKRTALSPRALPKVRHLAASLSSREPAF
jgi:hypothetical protein